MSTTTTTSALEYDGGYVLQLPTPSSPDQAPAPLPHALVSGLTLGNGKIALVPSNTDVDVQMAQISGTVGASFGGYSSGMLPLFRFNRLRFYSDNAADVTYALRTARLDMFTGVWTVGFALTRAADGVSLGAVETDLYPVQHLPFCVMQTVRWTVPASLQPSDASGPALAVYHEVYTPAGELADPRFNSSTLYVPSLAAPLYVLTAHGECGGSGGRGGRGAQAACEVDVASAYLFDDPALFAQCGYNVYTADRGRCFDRIALVQPSYPYVPPAGSGGQAQSGPTT
jgi:hypothetical protein